MSPERPCALCGNAVLWKPSEKTPLAALVAHELLARTVGKFKEAPQTTLAVVMLIANVIGMGLGPPIRSRATRETAKTRMAQVPCRPDPNGRLPKAMHQSATGCNVAR